MLTLSYALQEVFRLGVFSSASQRTISSVLPLLEKAADPGKKRAKDKLLPYRQAHFCLIANIAAPEHLAISSRTTSTVQNHNDCQIS